METILGTMLLIVIVVGFEYVSYRNEHRQMNSIQALKRQAISLDNALRKNGHPRRHARHFKGLA